MRILHITREGRELSGAWVRCYNFARELSQHGFEAGVYSFGGHLGIHMERELRMSFGAMIGLNWKAFRDLVQEARLQDVGVFHYWIAMRRSGLVTKDNLFCTMLHWDSSHQTKDPCCAVNPWKRDVVVVRECAKTLIRQELLLIARCDPGET